MNMMFVLLLSYFDSHLLILWRSDSKFFVDHDHSPVKYGVSNNLFFPF